MYAFYEIAEYLVVAWYLGTREERLPTSHGILDHALRAIVAEKKFPQRLEKYLNFVDTNVGMRCLELPTILDCAQESQLTAVPNPTYQTTIIKVREEGCREILKELDVSYDDAMLAGQSLKAAVERIAKMAGLTSYAQIA